MPPVVLGTAGSAALGAAATRTFAKTGYGVVITYSNNSSRADSLVADVEKTSPLPKPEVGSGSNFPSIKVDLSKKTDVGRLVSEAVAGAGRLDVVFPNGGWTSITDLNVLDDVDEEMRDKCWNINVKSYLWMMHATRKYLDDSQGCFITTASLAGEWGLKCSQEKLDASLLNTQLKRFATMDCRNESLLRRKSE
ncbi:short chain dehydrogenase [Diplocarpon mali]|nr:short chain dehydrogenase [Diplocarpon mali]